MVQEDTTKDQQEGMKEATRALLNSLHNLSYTNPLVIALSQLEGRHVLEAEEAYPEIFDNRAVRPFFNLFLSGGEKGILKLTSFGAALKTFRDYVHGLLGNDEVVARMNANLGMELSNPLKDYTYAALEQLTEKERLCLRIACTKVNALDSATEANRYLEAHGLRIEEKEFEEMARRIYDLMLVERYARGRIQPVDSLKPYILEVTANLETKKDK
jgi:hypothetical protein